MEQVLQSINDVCITLSQLDIKATPMNVKYLNGVYSELGKCMQIIQQSREEVGDEGEWKQENTEA